MMGSNANKFLLLLLLFRGCIGVTADKATTRVIDLSYRQNVDVEMLASVILQEKEPLHTVDVSSSALGDEGVERILQTLLSSRSKSVSDDTTQIPTLSLVAQTNGVTPKGAAKLIQTLLKQPSVEGERQSNLVCLDLSWNHLHSEAPGTKAFHGALEKLMEDPARCPRVLRLDRCGLGPPACRAIGKGLIHRYTHHHPDQTVPACLSLCGNTAIGDAGAAAIAATLRFVAISEDKKSDQAVLLFERLDLSACDIGDTGVDAIALALESSPCCLVQHLDLSNNRITERGAESLTRALAAAAGGRKGGPLLLSLDLSNNNLGDAGASSIATCLIENDLVPNIFLRSCHIHADGAESLGKALRKFARQGTLSRLSLDLSGNPFGVLRGKSKNDDGKYSASRLKSKASATAVSYMNQGISFLKKGLRDVGVDMGPSSTVESDDEEEKQAGMDDAIDASRARCGGKALASGFVYQDSDKDVQGDASSRSIQLGLRHCFFDHAAADALAELKVVANDDFGVQLDLDVRLNSVLEDTMVSALHGKDNDQLHEMAEKHSEKMRIIREAEDRAREAAKNAVRSSRGRNAYADEAWDLPSSLGDSDKEEERWDSDADYENEDDAY